MDFINKIKLNTTRKIAMFVNYYEKTEDGIHRIDKKMAIVNRKEVEHDLEESKEMGENIKIEYVNEEPQKIQLGVIYIQKVYQPHVPDRMYIHMLNG